ncbi:uncharacterized protein Triagg1_2662 [Trichoderma aggressivum f. europaeum]|uniref:Uncharacterized protein n=1 Tax=Trichoderma aggressivum f. europaeum TaxID=173218 RepID=A0AAE1JAZ7_9HYPO|nr:hypothetical protein Triagg1_2662 [Trichoderma aggressivum f. europaeum]
MVVRRRELIQYGERTGRKRSVAVEAVWGAISHGRELRKSRVGFGARSLVSRCPGWPWLALSGAVLALGLVPPHGTDKARARDCTVRGDGGEKQKVAEKSYSSAHKIDGLLRGGIGDPTMRHRLAGACVCVSLGA